MVGIPRNILFVFPARMTEGGMPEDSRQFIASVSRVHDGNVALLSRGEPLDPHGLLEDVEKINIDKGPFEIKSMVNSLSADDITVFFNFSNLFNVRLANRIRQCQRRYSVVPSWQVHEFLDWDRPFPANAVPTVKASEVNSKKFNTAGRGGVVEGKLTLRGAARAVKRRLYRKTLGKIFLTHASGIHVFSDFERNQIKRLIRPAQPRYLDIEFGTNVAERLSGPDKFPEDGKKKIVFWGRADYYYKGLATILDAIALAKVKGISSAFRFVIAGPDYNNGYRKLREHIKQAGIGEFVQIFAPGDYTPGTNGLLRSADYCIMASRWDGHARTLRECAAMGVPFITNRQTHFDRVVKQFGNGIIYADDEELSEILSNLNSKEVEAASRNARANREEFEKYIEWSSCALRFVESLADLQPLKTEGETSPPI